MTPAPDVQFLGDGLVTFMGPSDDVMILGSTPQEIACAQQVKAPVVAAGACTLGMFGLGLFGIYKSFKGHWAAGLTGFAAAGASYIIGAALAGASARNFQTCVAASGAPLQPKLPSP